METLAFIKAFEADHLLRAMLRGLPIWARRHRPATPDRCQHPSSIGDRLETLAWGEPSIDVERVRADAQPPGNLPNRIPAHRDLMHRIALELVAVIACPYGRLLALESRIPRTKERLRSGRVQSRHLVD